MNAIETQETRGAGHRVRQRWFLALGVTLVVLGIAAIGLGTFLELSSVLIFGPVLLASSAAQFLVALFSVRGREIVLHLIAAGLEAVFGFLILADPFESVTGLAAVAGLIWLAVGLARVARSAAVEHDRRGGMILTGIVAALIGITLFTGLAPARIWLLGLCIGIDFICHGTIWSVLGLSQPPTFKGADGAPAADH